MQLVFHDKNELMFIIFKIQCFILKMLYKHLVVENYISIISSKSAQP